MYMYTDNSIIKANDLWNYSLGYSINMAVYLTLNAVDEGTTGYMQSMYINVLFKTYLST